MAALGIHGYKQWTLQDPNDRNLTAELTARQNGVPFRDIWFTYIRVPERFLDDGSVNPHACGPYVDLTDSGLHANEIRRMIPDIQRLYPRDRAYRVAVFLNAKDFSDAQYATELRDAWPRCQLFNRSDHPEFWP